MEAAVAFDAQARQASGKGGARELRREKLVPVVVYNKDKAKENICLSLSEKEITREYLRGGFFSKIVSVNVDGKSFFALPKDIQLHPVTDRIEHADFIQVDAKSVLRVKVPVRFKNQDRCLGLKRGGVLNIVRHEVELFCSPNVIPRALEIDLVNNNIGDSIHISHVTLPEGVRPAISSRDFTIATIAGRGGSEDKEAAAATPAKK